MSRFIAHLLATVCLVCCTPAILGVAGAQPVAPLDSCVVIDTDFDIDDMMAIPMVIGSRHVAAIVTTEGYTLPPIGASAVSRLVSEPGQRAIPVVVGAGIGLPEDEIAEELGTYVLDYRRIMSRLNNFLPTELPPTAVPHDYVRDVENAVAGCRVVDVLIIGAFTSFLNYSPAIRSKIGNVVIMGKPLAGDPSNEPGNFSFNCEYDMASCEKVFYDQLPGLKYTYVDVPKGGCDKTPNTPGCPGTVFGPTLSMVQALQPAGLPNTLKQVLLNDSRTWALDTWEQAGYGGRSLFWDQSAALALVDPSLFGPVGSHVETVLSPDDFRARWTALTNLSAVYG